MIKNKKLFMGDVIINENSETGEWEVKINKKYVCKKLSQAILMAKAINDYNITETIKPKIT